MITYRICNSLFNEDITGTGAKLFGSRWNSKGTAMLYTTEHISLAVLEMLVHNRLKEFSIPLSLLHISIPDALEAKELSLKKLKKDWIKDEAYTQFMGDEFIRSQQSPVLKVPSAVITEEHNYLINPLHPDFKKIKITNTQIFETDKRLFSI